MTVASTSASISPARTWSQLFFDAEDGIGHSRRETAEAGLVIGNLPTGCDRLYNRLPMDKCDIDAGLLDAKCQTLPH